jgi:putative cardiolipin synthase
MNPGLRLSGVSAIILAAGIAGCASLPEDVERTPSHALENPWTTPIGRMVTDQADRHPGASGFALVSSGRVAFTARIAMAAVAEKTLDVQYYIWESDSTGAILVERLAQAADRGVRVRILVDDINVKDDESVAALDAHPNIEVRIFNPFAHRAMKGLGFVTDLSRVNHRMHNKVMIADGALAIAGGRNIGNHYFGVDTHANFRDLDILAAGPIVPEISATFDEFWNGDWSFPVSGLLGYKGTSAELAAGREDWARMVAALPYPFSLDQDIEALAELLGRDLRGLTWAPGVVVADDPAAVGQEDDAGPGEIATALANKRGTVEREVLIESAYFVTTKGGVEAARKLVERGVRIRVLTNSLVSNDVLAAHAGYEKRRRDLLEAGVELYELRPDSRQAKVDQSVVSGESQAALHTKAIVFDRESVFVGSYNLDPRSANINTEIGIYVESPALAAELIEFMDSGTAPENAYRVVLDDNGNLSWIETAADGSQVRYDREPQSGFWQRLMADILKLLPIESQL